LGGVDWRSFKKGLLERGDLFKKKFTKRNRWKGKEEKKLDTDIRDGQDARRGRSYLSKKRRERKRGENYASEQNYMSKKEKRGWVKVGKKQIPGGGEGNIGKHRN